ncbi:MAG: translation elongation factor Ts [Anaerolineales bacterium]
MAVTAAQVKELRAATSAPMLDCKRALETHDGDMDKAIDWLREKGLSKVAKKVNRAAKEGVVDAYIHHGNRVGVIVEVNCETDFVARLDDFRAFVHDLLLHIAMANPSYLTRADVPEDVLEKEKAVYAQQAREEGKPPEIAEKIAAGRLVKFYEESCLLQQRFIKDEDLSVQDLINNTIAKVGENIVVRRFDRYELGG